MSHPILSDNTRIQRARERFRFVAMFISYSLFLASCNGKFEISTSSDNFSIVNSGVSSSSTPLVSWSDSNASSGYTLRVSSTPACQDALQEFTIKSEKSQRLSPLANGTYYLCLSTIKGVTSRIASNNGLALVVTAPMAVINNAPSGYNATSRLDVSISGGDFYKHKLVAAATGCSAGDGYSQEQPISKKITDDISLKDTFAYTLCVVAKDPQGNWQDFTLASKANWNLFRLSFTGKSSPTASISERMFYNQASSNETIWTLSGLCDHSLGNVTVGGSGLSEATSVSCTNEGTWSQSIYWTGPNRPYLWNHEGTVIWGAKTIFISQLGTPTIFTKIFQASYTQPNLILISDAKSLVDAVSAGFLFSDYAVQTADIDLTGITLPSAAGPGVFEGNGFKISNFSSNASFFSIAYGLSNLRLENIKISAASGTRLGGMVTSFQSSSSRGIGLYTSGSLESTSTTAWVGGLFGYATAGGIVVRSGSKATVTGGRNIGGLVGRGGSFTMEQVYFEGAVTSNLSTTAAVGGIFGQDVGALSLKNCYVKGSITHSLSISVNSAYGVAGLFGSSSGLVSPSNCYSAPTISAPLAAGITDYLSATPSQISPTNVYYSTESSCSFNSGTACPGSSGSGKSDAQLKQKATFNGFDFDSANPVWKIVEGVSSPVFTWQ
jgi:hypothetical protein